MKVKEYLRKYPHIFKFLSAVKENITDPFTTGFVFNYFAYLLLIYRREKRYLLDNGFKNVHVFKPRSWRYHEGIDGANRRYYKAKYNNENCFIKIANNDMTIENEILVSRYMMHNQWTFSPKSLFIDSKQYQYGKVLALEFIDNLHQFALPYDIDVFRKICKSYFEILMQLRNAGIIHADVHYRNLLLNNSNELVLLDYGISVVASKNNNVDYTARPGTFFIQKGNVRIYDDAYSFIKMLEKLNVPDEFINTEEYKMIFNQVGVFSKEIIL